MGRFRRSLLLSVPDWWSCWADDLDSSKRPSKEILVSTAVSVERYTKTTSRLRETCINSNGEGHSEFSLSLVEGRPTCSSLGLIVFVYLYNAVFRNGTYGESAAAGCRAFFIQLLCLIIYCSSPHLYKTMKHHLPSMMMTVFAKKVYYHKTRCCGYIFLVFLTLLNYCQGDVTALNTGNFSDITSGKTVFVKFFAPW